MIIISQEVPPIHTNRSYLGHQIADQPLQLPSPPFSGRQHLLVIGTVSAVILTHHLVGDEGQAKNAEAAVTGHHHLGHRAHPWMAV